MKDFAWLFLLTLLISEDSSKFISADELEKLKGSLEKDASDMPKQFDLSNPAYSHMSICEDGTRKLLDNLINPDTEGDRVRELCEQNGGMWYDHDMGRTIPVCKQDGQYCSLQCIRKVNYPPCFGK